MRSVNWRYWNGAPDCVALVCRKDTPKGVRSQVSPWTPLEVLNRGCREMERWRLRQVQYLSNQLRSEMMKMFQGKRTPERHVEKTCPGS